MEKWFGVIKENSNVEEGTKVYKRDEDYGGNKGDKPGWKKGNEDAKAKEDHGFAGDDGPEDYEPLMEEDEIQEGSGDRGDEDREQGRKDGRTFRADSGGHLEERVFQAVMKILKDK